MARSETFWNLIANKYSKQPIKDEEAYQIKLSKTQEYFTPDSLVLEFGCGTGSTALVHAPHVKKIVAIDYSKNMVKIANRKAKEKSIDNVEFIKATLFDQPYKPQTYDVVLGLNILHLLGNFEETIKRSFDLLKPGGVFITSTVCIAEHSGLLKYILPIASAMRIIPFLNVFDIATLKNSIAQTGFTILEDTIGGKDKDIIFIIAKK